MDFSQIKEIIKEEIVKRIDKGPAGYSEEKIKQEITNSFNNIIRKRIRDIPELSGLEQKEMLSQIINEIVGLGSLEELMSDPTITEIMIDGPKQVCIERDGKIEVTNITFRDEDQLSSLVDRILAPLGRRVTQLEPYVDARLKDGSRVNVIRSPLSLTGTVITIRKFNRKSWKIQDLIAAGTLTQEVAEFLGLCVKNRLNIILAGGTSSGKTTTLNILLAFASQDERVITIEDTVELNLAQPFLIRLETRMPTIEGKGEITIRDLLRNSLHMRPDRIIVGEVRGDEVNDMLQAMNVGHEGSMTTIHANTSEDCLNRLEIMALMGRPNFTVELIKREIISAIDLIILQKRLPNGKRKIVQITELRKAKKGEYELNDLFVLDDNSGQLAPTGFVPEFYPLLKQKFNYIYSPWEKS